MREAGEKPHTERWAYRRLYQGNVFARASRLVPLLRGPGCRFVGRTIAWSYAVTQPAIRRVVRDNLALLKSGPVSESEAVRTFVNFGATMGDYIAAGALPVEKAVALCGEFSGFEHLEAARASGRGLILATGHYGFFELGTVALSRMGCRMAVVSLPEPTPELTDWRAGWRRRWGAETIPVGADPFSSLQVIRALEDGQCVAMLVDRPIGERSQSVDLPNGHIPFSISPALLAWMTGCPILPTVISRRDNGRYGVITKPAVHIRRDAPGGRTAEIARCTREVADSLVEEMRRDPCQWYQFVPLSP